MVTGPIFLGVVLLRFGRYEHGTITVAATKVTRALLVATVVEATFT